MNKETNKTSHPSNIQMLTVESDSKELYQKLCEVVEELEEYKNKAYNYEQGYHIHSLRADETEISNWLKDCSHHGGYLKFEEPPKTGWDLYITPEFTLSNIKPINWFNRKMQELILGFKWKRQ